MADPVATLLEETTGTSTTLVTAAANVGSGEPIALSISYDPGVTITSVTDSAGNTYSLKGSTGSATGKHSMYVAESVTGSASLVTTVVFSGTPFGVIHRVKISAGATYDATAESFTDGFEADPLSATSGSPLTVGELVLLGITNGGSAQTWLAGTAISVETDDGAWWAGSLGGANAPSTSAFSFSVSGAGGGGRTAHIIGFKAGGGGGAASSLMPPPRAGLAMGIQLQL